MIEQNKIVHASWLGRYYWCSQYFLLLLDGHKPDISDRRRVQEGRAVDQWLRQRPMTPREKEFREKLDGYRNPELNEFIRPYRDWLLVGDFDDLIIDFRNRLITIREFKTVGSWNGINQYVLAPASFQIKSYAYILKPIIEGKLDFQINNFHYVEFYTRNGIFIERFTIEYNPDEYLEQLDYLHRLWRGEEEVIPPARWKCRSCPLIEVCPLFPRLWPEYQETGEVGEKDHL